MWLLNIDSTPNKQKCREHKNPAHTTAYYNIEIIKQFFNMHEKNGIWRCFIILSSIIQLTYLSSRQKWSTIFNFAFKIRFGRGNRALRSSPQYYYVYAHRRGYIIHTSSLLLLYVASRTLAIYHCRPLHWNCWYFMSVSVFEPDECFFPAANAVAQPHDITITPKWNIF